MNDYEKFYMEQTGLNPRLAPRRIQILKDWMERHHLTFADVRLFDDPNKPRRDYRKGKPWTPGKERGRIIMLGYTNSGRVNFVKSAIFAERKE